MAVDLAQRCKCLPGKWKVVSSIPGIKGEKMVFRVRIINLIYARF